jgi:hypothetical protein
VAIQWSFVVLKEKQGIAPAELFPPLHVAIEQDLSSILGPFWPLFFTLSASGDFLAKGSKLIYGMRR